MTQTKVEYIANKTRSIMKSRLALLSFFAFYSTLILLQTVLYLTGYSLLTELYSGWEIWFVIYGTGFASMMTMYNTFLSARVNKWFIIPNLISISIWAVNALLITKFLLDFTKLMIILPLIFIRFFNWNKGEKPNIEPKILGVKKLVPLILACIVFSLTLGFIFTKYEIQPKAYGDAFNFTIGLVGTYLITKEYVDGWFLFAFMAIPLVIMFGTQRQWSTIITIVTMAILNFGTGMSWLDIKYKKNL